LQRDCRPRRATYGPGRNPRERRSRPGCALRQNVPKTILCSGLGGRIEARGDTDSEGPGELLSDPPELDKELSTVLPQTSTAGAGQANRSEEGDRVQAARSIHRRRAKG